MQTSFELSSQDLSDAVTAHVAKTHPGINLSVVGLQVSDGTVIVQAEILARVRKARGPRKARSDAGVPRGKRAANGTAHAEASV